MIKDRIKELREKNGLTISAFAKSLGISPTSASLYESGKQNPGKKTIAKICEVYGVDEEYLRSTTTADTTDKAVEDTSTDKATTTAKEDDKASTDETDKAVEEKKRGRRPKKTDVVNVDEKEPDISAILARVEEIGLRKAAEEAGVAWQTVNKWKKDAEKAELTTPDDLKEGLEVIAEVMGEMIPPTTEEKVAASATTTEEKPDISAILARVEEIGLRKAAAEAGVAWQTVNKWKKDAASTTPPQEEKKPKKKQEKEEQEVKKNDVVDAEENKTAIIIQSPLGGNITPAQILKKIPAGTDSVYVRVTRISCTG